MGGMTWRDGPTLGDRAGLGPKRAQGARGARHCWVHDPIYGTWLPGVLLKWHRQGDTWRALVVYAIPFEAGITQRWVFATDLRRLE